MKQLKAFNARNAGTKAGWCLRNVRMGYGIAPFYNSAWDNWNNTPQKKNRSIPTGVDVPLFYDYTDRNGNRYGHINVRLKDGRIWNDGKYYQSLSTFERAWRNVTYVGWSTHVNNVQVIKESNRGDIMDTDAKVKGQYYTLRGNEGTASERKHWVGKPYEEFNATARPEVASRTQHIKNLESAVSTLRKERDTAKKELVEAEKKLVVEQDKMALLQSQLKEANAGLTEAQASLKKIEAEYQKTIDELNKVVRIKDKEIDRLSKELAGCEGEPLTWSQHLVLGVKGLLQALNPINKGE